MRVLSLSTLFPNATAPNFGIFVERQLAELHSRPDVSVTIVNPIGEPPWPLSRHPRYRALACVPDHEVWRGLDVYRPRFTLLPGIGGPLNPRAIAHAVLPLVRWLHASNPFDVIAADFFYPDGPAAMRIAQSLDLPFTIKARGADIHHWAQVKGARGQLIEAAHKASGLLAVSEALADDIAALGVDRAKIRVHYTGCDQTRFAPRDRAPAKAELGVSGPLVASVGALIPRKRHALLIEAVAAMPDVTLMIAGQGPMMDELRALGDRLGMGQRLILAGAVPHDDVPRLLAAADAMALVSESEGLANAWVEALACGTPIVLSEAGGARELLRDPVAGRIVEPTPDAVRNALAAILSDPPEQEAVRETVSRFTWARNGDELEAFLREVAAVGRPSPSCASR